MASEDGTGQERRRSPGWLERSNEAPHDAAENVSEEEPLLPRKTSRSLWNPPVRRYVPVEIIAFCFLFSMVLLLPLTQFYIVDKVSEKYGGVNSTDTVVCGASSGNSTSARLEEKVQAEAADYTMFLAFTISFPGIFQTFVFGALSDKYGRRGGLFLAFIGLLLRLIIYLFVFEYDLDLAYLFLGNVLDGLTGNFGIILTALFGIVADITQPGHKRALRIAIVQAVMSFAAALATFVSGFWVTYGGYKQPVYFLIALTAACLIFSIFVLPETRRNISKDSLSFKEHLQSLKRSFQLYTKDTPDKRRWKLLVSLFSFITSFSVDLTKATVLILYLLASPLCWERTWITTYSAIRAVVNWLCIVGVTRTCGRYVSEISIAIVACLSNCLFLIFMGIGQYDVMILIAAVLGIVSEASPPMMRSVMSRLVGPDEQGALFATISAVEVLETAVLGVLVTLIYRLSLSFYPGLVFFILAFFTLVTSGVLLILKRGMKREDERRLSTTVVVDPEDSKLPHI